MDKMSLIALLTVGIPDNIIMLLFMLATCDEKRYINSNLSAILKFVAVNFISLGLIYYIRLLAPNIIVSCLTIAITYSFLLKLFYNNIEFKWLTISSIVYLLLSYIMEVVYVPASLTALNVSIQDVYNSNSLRFYLFLPRLVVSAFSIVLIMKYQNVRKGISFYIKSKKIFRIILIVNLLTILSMYYLFLTYFVTMIYITKILSCAIIAFIALNSILLFKLVATIVQESYTKIQIERGSKIDED